MFGGDELSDASVFPIEEYTTVENGVPTVVAAFPGNSIDGIAVVSYLSSYVCAVISIEFYRMICHPALPHPTSDHWTVEH